MGVFGKAAFQIKSKKGCFIMVIYRQITIASIFFIFFATPMTATAIPITYEFDAIDLWNTNPEFSGSISIESTTLGVQTSSARSEERRVGKEC